MAGLTLPFAGGTNDGGIAFSVTESAGGIAIKGSSFVQQQGPLSAYQRALLLQEDPLAFRQVRRRPDAAGVSGESNGNPGVYGMSQVDSGVEGQSKWGPGVHGLSDSGRGVVGYSGSSDGVQGLSDKGIGVYGEGPGHGVYGKSARGSAVRGDNTSKGNGVRGDSVDGNGVSGVSRTGNGVRGESTSGDGVWGYSENGNGVFGSSNGAFGKAGYFDGDVAVTGDICLVNQDCAEDFAVADVDDASPGTVMVFTDDGRVTSCRKPYDRRVGGVVSGAGGAKAGIILGRGQEVSDRRPLALIGTVYCKVDAGYGPISVGDQLTTSATAGHAMKASNAAEALGATIGKAIGRLDEGRGLIPVLVSLR
jgi:hypothetical protein